MTASITVSIMYTHETGRISGLCVNAMNVSQISVLIPHIGETIIDAIEHVEYEVKDIIRMFNGNEYLVQVYLKRRTKNKYKT